MTIGEHLDQFFGRPIQQFEAGDSLASPVRSAFRLSSDYDEQEAFSDAFATLTADPLANQLEALVIGAWSGAFEGGESTGVVEMLVSARDQLTNLKAIFLGDITYEECEISWIVQSDVSSLLAAYPQLGYFAVRGSGSLSFGKLSHSGLRTLRVECGGLPAEIMNEIAQAKLPELTTLELWLGDDGYGRGIDEETLQSLLKSTGFPKLKTLGLCNDAEADETAKIVAESEILKRLETLDMSLGAIGDDGAKALIASPYIKSLKKLDLRHHYMTTEVMEQFKALGIEVDVSEQKEEDVYGDDRYRHITASE